MKRLILDGGHDAEHNDIQDNYNKHKILSFDTLSITKLSIPTLNSGMLSVIMLNVIYAECHLCCASKISPLSWMSLCWMSWRPLTNTMAPEQHLFLFEKDFFIFAKKVFFFSPWKMWVYVLQNFFMDKQLFWTHLEVLIL